MQEKKLFKITTRQNKCSKRAKCEDSAAAGHVLIRGSIYTKVLEDAPFFAAVCDGVTGSGNGDFASGFVAGQIAQLNAEAIKSRKQLKDELLKIDHNLRILNDNNPQIGRPATTLSGVFVKDINDFWIFHAGDSRVGILRNDILIRLTRDQEERESGYLNGGFGGSDGLSKGLEVFQADVRDVEAIVLMTDGVFDYVAEEQLVPLVKFPDKLMNTAGCFDDATLMVIKNK